MPKICDHPASDSLARPEWAANLQCNADGATPLAFYVEEALLAIDAVVRGRG